MTTERSDKAYSYWKESSERFDYFLTGVTGALTAYIGQGLMPAKIGVNSTTVALISVLCLVASIICGLRRIEKTILIYKLQAERLYNEEKRGMLLSESGGVGLYNKASGEVYSPQEIRIEAEKSRLYIEKLREGLEKGVESASSYYIWRNIFLFVGFILLIVSRIMPAYM